MRVAFFRHGNSWAGRPCHATATLRIAFFRHELSDLWIRNCLPAKGLQFLLPIPNSTKLNRFVKICKFLRWFFAGFRVSTHGLGSSATILGVLLSPVDYSIFKKLWATKRGPIARCPSPATDCRPPIMSGRRRLSIGNPAPPNRSGAKIRTDSGYAGTSRQWTIGNPAKRLSAFGATSFLVQTRCQTSPEHHDNLRPRGNSRPSRNLWPKNIFRQRRAYFGRPASGRERLSILADVDKFGSWRAASCGLC
jgi:hypothetical protein